MVIQNKKIEYNNIIYCINEEENEANVIGCEPNQLIITIPQSFNIGSKEYEITSINDNAFKNSKLEIIEISSESNLKLLVKMHFLLQKSIASQFYHQSHQLEKVLFLIVTNLKKLLFHLI